jgi:PTH1 family peptidyl-tRNA hydrolase
MILIVGLGNPGEKYAKTRHNLGFMVVDELARKILPLAKTKWEENKKFNSQFIRIDPQTILVKPQTMMNASGFAVAKMANFYHIEPVEIWVIHDDVDLPLGKIKIRLGGAAAGHHGAESIIKQLGADQFVRFRLGIGHPRLRPGYGGQAGRGSDRLVEKYVLRRFDVNEASEVKQMIKKTVEAVRVALDDGLEKAMNQFNQ